MKEAANRGGLPSRRGWLNVRCERRRVARRAWFVHLQFEIGRFVQKGCGNLGVRCCFSQPKQDRRLTHEVLFSNHLIFPVVSQRQRDYSGIGAIVPNRTYKSEHSGFMATPVSSWATAKSKSGPSGLKPVRVCPPSHFTLIFPFASTMVPIFGVLP